MTVLVEQKFLGLDSKLTMTSLEIAQLTCKRHDNVLRKISELAVKGIIRAIPQIEEKYYGAKKGRLKRLCRLNKDESINLVANLCPLFTKKIIDRWLELEQKLVEPTYDQLQDLSVEMQVSERLGKIGSGLMHERRRVKRELKEKEKELLAGCQLRLDFDEQAGSALPADH